MASWVLTAPAVQLLQHLRGAETHVVLIASSCGAIFLLVMARMAALVAAQRTAAITDGLTGLKTRRYVEQRLSIAVGPGTQLTVTASVGASSLPDHADSLILSADHALYAAKEAAATAASPPPDPSR